MKVAYGETVLGGKYTDVFDNGRQSRFQGYLTGEAARFTLMNLRKNSRFNPTDPEPNKPKLMLV